MVFQFTVYLACLCSLTDTQAKVLPNTQWQLHKDIEEALKTYKYSEFDETGLYEKYISNDYF